MTVLPTQELEERAEQVASEFDGMIPYCRPFYGRSVRYAVTRAYQAFERFDIRRRLGDSEENQVSAVHEALGHAAALSRFFFPSGFGKKSYRPLHKARARRLRAIYDVEDDSLLKSRSLRNSLEHFEERLDLYLLENSTGSTFPDARIGSAELADEAVGHVYKLVDPEQEIFVVLGEKHTFGAIRREVARIHDLVVTEGRGES